MKKWIASLMVVGSVAASGCVFDPSGIDAFCGNGILEPGEECDGADLGGKTCQSLGYDGGVLGCLSTCVLDTSQCTGAGSGEGVCGDGRVDPGEQCDGTDLGGATCESLGYDGGQLACSTSCTYDARGCTGGEAECGNGILEPGEECDDGTDNSDTRPDACRTDCTLAYCGDGVKDSLEECDGADLGGMDCESLGYSGGRLGCTQACRFDLTGCEVSPSCGDGKLDPGEECDGTVPQDATTCEELGYYGGHVRCTSQCTLDYSECVAYGRCGDGVLQEGEECDDGTANSDTEPDACRTDCKLPHCGDGVVDSSEQCDGTDFGGATCADYGQFHPAQALRCNPDCTVDTSGCPYCGDGRLDATWEECDGTDLGSIATCHDASEIYYESDAISCSSSCTIDTSRCPYCGDGRVDSAYGEICDPGSDTTITFGDFTGWCVSCTEKFLVDQIEDATGTRQDVTGAAFVSSTQILPVQGQPLFMVAGYTEGPFLGQDTVDPTPAGFVLRYDESGSRHDSKIFWISRGFPMSFDRGTTVYWADATTTGEMVLVGRVDYNENDSFIRAYDDDLNQVFSYSSGISDSNRSDVLTRVVIAGTDVYATQAVYDPDTYEGEAKLLWYTLDGDTKDTVSISAELGAYLDQKYGDGNYSLYLPYPLAVTATDTHVYVGGLFVILNQTTRQISTQAFVARYDRELKFAGITTWGVLEGNGRTYDVSERVWAIVPGGPEIVVIGTYRCYSFTQCYFPSSSGGMDIFVMPLQFSSSGDATPNPASALLLGGSQDDIVRDVAVDGTKAYLVGSTYGPDFQGLASYGGLDGFVCRVDTHSLSLDGCNEWGTAGDDSFRTVTIGVVGGRRTLVIAGWTTGAAEPGYTKPGQDADALILLYTRAGL